LPILAVVIGEGAPAVALRHRHRQPHLNLEHSYYSVHFARRLRGHSLKTARTPTRPRRPQVTASTLIELGIAERNRSRTPRRRPRRSPRRGRLSSADAILKNLAQLDKARAGTAARQRYAKFRAMGIFKGSAPSALDKPAPPVPEVTV
jgi:acetyl-CoA carboxylase alpha subunit